MPPSLVTLTWAVPDASLGALTGTITFAPVAILAGATVATPITVTDAADQLIIAPAGVTRQLGAGVVELVPTDNASLSPAGWMYLVTTAITGLPVTSQTYLIPHSPSPVDLSALVEAVAVEAVSPYALQTGLTAEIARAEAAEAALIPLGDLPIAIAIGGTGSTSAGAALSALGAAAASALTTETSRAETAESANVTAISTEVTRAETAEALLAPKASPALTGSPTAPTKTALTSNTDIATTAYADSAVAVAQAASLPQGNGGPVYSATANGLKCDDSTDDTAALNTLLASMATFGGGTLFFPSLSKILGQVVIPATVSGGGQLQQAPFRFQGTVPNRPGESESGVTFPTGGLDLRYAGRTDTGCGTTARSNVVTDASAVSGDYGQIIISPGNLPDRTYVMAVTPGVGYSLNNGARATNASASFTIGGGKLQALGIGTLELDHMLLCDQGTSSQPFVLATGTTVDMQHCAILGNAAKNSSTCDQDPVVLGGPGQGAALTTALTSGVPVTSIAVSALPVAINAGGGIVITNGTSTQTITTSAAAVGATSITASFTPNANYGAGSAVLFGGQQAAVGGTAYSVPAANMQGYGSHIHDNFFNRVRRILMQTWTADVTIDENIWWQQCGTNLAVTPATLTTAVNVAGSPYTTLAVTALPAAVATGDQIQLGTNSPGSVTAVISQVATASAPAAAGATSISISSFTATGTYAIGVKVINTTAGIGAPIEVYAAPGNASNIVAANNHFDMFVNYSYAVRLGALVYESTITGNGLYNVNAANVAGYRFDSGAQYNTLIPGIFVPAIPMVDDQSATAGSQLVLRPQQSQPSLFSQGFITQGFSSRYTDGLEPSVYDTSGNHWQQVGSAGVWTWDYTAAGGAQTQILQLNLATAAILFLDFLGATAGGNAYLRNLNGNLNLWSGAGYHVALGDGTRTTDVEVINGNLQVTHLLAQGTAPTVAAASSSTSLSIAGQDTAHNVALTTAASISAGASVATITYGLSYATRAPSMTPRFAVTPKNLASATAQPYITGDSQTGYAIALANPPAGATAMAFDVHVIAS